MKHYDSIPRIQDDGTLKGETVWGFNKLDGQNFCVTYNCRKKTWGPYGSRTVTVDENSEQFGPVVKWFNASNYSGILSSIVKDNSGKKQVFNGVDEVTFFFEWYGENSFAGKHQEGDEMHLALIDVFLKKKGYMEPDDYYNLFNNSGIEIKEGVVFKRSTMMKGQRRPSVKVKTKWWLDKLHSMYSEEECKKLE